MDGEACEDAPPSKVEKQRHKRAAEKRKWVQLPQVFPITEEMVNEALGVSSTCSKRTCGSNVSESCVDASQKLVATKQWPMMD
mmetsp:Transcript_57026/g.101825  ORF Transcript_57026/g.101825 Transcript_57026/m.101825 type:complete len:83 (+) Transcript_57026:317-565(+)